MMILIAILVALDLSGCGHKPAKTVIITPPPRQTLAKPDYRQSQTTRQTQSSDIPKETAKNNLSVRIQEVPEIDQPPVPSSEIPTVSDLPLADSGRIDIYISAQRLEYWKSDKKLLTAKISSAFTGINSPANIHPEKPHNHVGKYLVYLKQQRHYSKQYHCWMNYCLFFCNGHAIHACQISDIKHLGRPASHGCIRVSPENMKKIFAWASVNTEINIYE